METATTAAWKRAPDGRWATGNSGGSGRPRTRPRTYAAAQALFDRCATPERMEALIASLFERAQAGDNQAAKLLLDRWLPANAMADDASPAPHAMDWSKLSTPELHQMLALREKARVDSPAGHGGEP
jgi:hypothetical protein